MADFKRELRECQTEYLKICWKMVLQNPPLKFVFPKAKSKFNPTEQATNGDDSMPVPEHLRAKISDENTVVSHSIHPALYHDNYVLVRANVVLCKLQHQASNTCNAEEIHVACNAVVKQNSMIGCFPFKRSFKSRKSKTKQQKCKTKA